MLQEINNWSDYRSKLREFDAVLEHGKAVGAALAGAAPAAAHAGYGRQVFAKLLAHCIALRKLGADPNEPLPQEPWDLASMAALALCVLEAHDTFEYIAGHMVSDAERGFRIRLWELHDATRRLKILARIGSTDPAVAGIRADAARLQLALESHEHMATLPAELQASLRLRLARNDPPEFHLGRRQRCELSGVDADWHEGVSMQLAQYMHTLPFSVHLPTDIQPGTPEALRLMAQPLVFALPFLTRTVQAMDTLMPGRAPRPPSRTSRTMALWRDLAATGMKAGA